MTTTPPAITALPAAPDPNNRTTFNALAYPWSAALPTFGTQVSAVGANVKANADEAVAAAVSAIAKEVLTDADATATAADRIQTGLDRVSATSSASTATTQAGIATTKAGEASASAIAAAASVASIAGGPVASVNGMTGVVTGIATTANITSERTAVATLTNKTITDIVFALTGTTPAFLATNGAVQTWTLTAASTPTNSLTSGQSIILVITPGAFAITWPSVVWTKQGGSGAAPTLFSAGKTSVVLWMVGAVLYGSHLGDNA